MFVHRSIKVKWIILDSSFVRHQTAKKHSRKLFAKALLNSRKSCFNFLKLAVVKLKCLSSSSYLWERLQEEWNASTMKQSGIHSAVKKFNFKSSPTSTFCALLWSVPLRMNFFPRFFALAIKFKTILKLHSILNCNVSSAPSEVSRSSLEMKRIFRGRVCC